MGQKIKQLFKGFWNDKDGLSITDSISISSFIFFLILTAFIIIKLLYTPSIDMLKVDGIFKFYDKFASIITIVAVGYYGNGMLNKIRNGYLSTKLNQVLNTQQNINDEGVSIENNTSIQG